MARCSPPAHRPLLTQALVLPATLPCRLTKVVAEGKGKKGVDPALRAAAVGMADKAVGVRVGCLIAWPLLPMLSRRGVLLGMVRCPWGHCA